MPTETRPDRELRKTEEFTINTQGSFRKKRTDMQATLIIRWMENRTKDHIKTHGIMFEKVWYQ